MEWAWDAPWPVLAASTTLRCLAQARAFVAKLAGPVTSACMPIDPWVLRGQPPAWHSRAVLFLSSRQPLWAAGGLPFQARVEESKLSAACRPAVHGAPRLAGTVVALCVSRRVTRLQARPSGVRLITFLQTPAWKVISLKGRSGGGALSPAWASLPSGLGWGSQGVVSV